MSGPAIHHIVAEQYLKNILKLKYTDPASLNFWNQMSSGNMGPLYNLGAQGPDFLFFNMNDWPAGGVAKTVAQTYWEVQDFLDDLTEKVKSMIPPELWQAVATLEGLAEDAVERSATLSEIADLAGDVQDNINAIKLNIEAKIKEYVTDSFDLFNLIRHPQQHGQEFKEWWWFDTMHIRRSGRFTAALLKNSRHGDPERAYALGYLTHFAADAVGHPFVNIISGGPYRTHSQRHKVAENHQDVWAWQKYHGTELITSNLAKDYIVNGDPRQLPSAITQFLITCINRVYYDNGSPLYGKGIAEEDLNVAYRTWLLWFTASTNDNGLPLPQPYSLTAEVVEAWNKFVSNVGDIGDYVGDSVSGGGGLWGFLKALAALIAGPILLAAALIDFIIGEILTLGAAPIRYFLSLSYEALYNSYQNLRKGLVMNGFAFPKVSDLTDPITRHMLHSKDVDHFGHNARTLVQGNAYPASKFKLPNNEPESHLIYPLLSPTVGEPNTCVGAPDSYFSADASWYIDGPRLPFNANQFEYFRRFAESGTGGGTQVSVDAKFAELALRASRGGLGNAVALSDALYAEFLARGGDTLLVDFNLDSDRGYGFKSWRKVRNIGLLNKPLDTPPSDFNVPIEDDRQVPNVQDDILYPDWSVR